MWNIACVIKIVGKISYSFYSNGLFYKWQTVTLLNDERKCVCEIKSL